MKGTPNKKATRQQPDNERLSVIQNEYDSAMNVVRLGKYIQSIGK